MNDKERQRLYESISAYIDGESDAPRDIERLIETDADAARLHAELSRLSNTLKALPAPDVHPAFATRVMAHVRDERAAANAVPAWRFVLPKVLGTLAAMVLIALAVWPFWPNSGITAPAQGDPMVAEVLRLRNAPEQALAAHFGPLISDPESDGAWANGGEPDGGLAMVVDPALDEDYVAVAGKVASLLGNEVDYDDDADVFAALDSLNESQSAALRAMLQSYAEGGNELL